LLFDLKQYRLSNSSLRTLKAFLLEQAPYCSWYWISDTSLIKSTRILL